jgi:thiol-disulfide isomerase/thioredoxin
VRLAATYVLGLTLALAACRRADGPPAPPDDPDARAVLALPVLDGATFDPATLAGQVVMVSFWSPSCGYCAKEIPILQKLAAELGPRGVTLVTVMVDGTPARARRFIDRVGVTAPVLLGSDELRDHWNVNAYPFTIVVDRDGKARHAVRGLHDEAYFRDLLEARLGS